MASACALAISSGKSIYISRLSRPAGRSKRIFTEGVAARNIIRKSTNLLKPKKDRCAVQRSFWP